MVPRNQESQIRNNPVFDTVRVISAYKRHKNLADLLVRGRLGRPNAVTNPPSQDEDEDQRVEAMLDALIEVINRDNLCLLYTSPSPRD